MWHLAVMDSTSCMSALQPEALWLLLTCNTQVHCMHGVAK